MTPTPTLPAAPAPGERAAASSAIGWAFFLACSWTWCIGMFLPVLLVEDFGVWGWVAFAVPNVLGALAVGVLPRTATTCAAAQRFAPWALAFSLATIAFHIAFLVWMTPMVVSPFLQDAPLRIGAGVGATLALLAASAALSRLRDAGFIRAAIVVFALSLMFLALMAWASQGRAFAIPALHGQAPAWALFAAAPALAFGFLLCPQLDLTIRRAREATTGSSRSLAFIGGFGVLFLGMIVASLFYAAGWARGWINLWIIAHFAGQSLFTIAAHLRELGLAPADFRAPRWTPAAIALGLATGVIANLDGAGRHVYQSYLGLYAVVFPVFVWTLLAGPRVRPAASPTRVALLTIALAAPCFALGHLTQTWWLLGAGVGLALALPPAWRALPRARIA